MIDKKRVKNIDAILKLQVNPPKEETIVNLTEALRPVPSINPLRTAQARAITAAIPVARRRVVPIPPPIPVASELDLAALQRYSPSNPEFTIGPLSETNILRCNRSQYTGSVFHMEDRAGYEFRLTYHNNHIRSEVSYAAVHNMLGREYSLIDYITEVWYNLARQLELALRANGIDHSLEWR